MKNLTETQLTCLELMRKEPLIACSGAHYGTYSVGDVRFSKSTFDALVCHGKIKLSEVDRPNDNHLVIEKYILT